jgi:hypothetical protein
LPGERTGSRWLVKATECDYHVLIAQLEASMTDSHPTSDWRPLALMLALATAMYAILYRLVPFDVRAYLLFPFGAWALYSGARLSLRVALPLTLGVFVLTDLILYRAAHYSPNYIFYVCLIASVLIGRGLLRRSEQPWRIATGSIAGYAFFFLVSNFAAWAEPAREYYRPYTAATLLRAYGEGLEFLRMQPGHLVGDLLLSFVLFGLHFVLAKVYFPSEQVVPREAV